jgi:hypothetical protein
MHIPAATHTIEEIQQDMMLAIQAMINYDATKIPTTTQLSAYFKELFQRLLTLDLAETLQDRLRDFRSSMLMLPADQAITIHKDVPSNGLADTFPIQQGGGAAAAAPPPPAHTKGFFQAAPSPARLGKIPETPISYLGSPL